MAGSVPESSPAREAPAHSPGPGAFSRTLSSVTAIIDAQDLAGYMKRTITPNSEDETAANEIIDGLEADLEAYLKRPIVPTVVANEKVKITPTGKAFLSATPVVTVTSFAYDGTAIENYSLESYGFSGLSSVFTPPTLAGPTIFPLVSYTGGLPGDDPASTFGKKARAVLLRVANRDFNWVVRQDLGGVSLANVEGTQLSAAGGVKGGRGGFHEDELEGFIRWKRRRARR